MLFGEITWEIAERAGAVVLGRRFTKRTNPDRPCCVDLQTIPPDSVVVCVDRLVEIDARVESAFETSCSCGNRRGRERHRQCDYAVVSDDIEPHFVMIEVKTGRSNQDSDVSEGFEQLICSKVVLMTMLSECDIDASHISITGVVVSPATYLTDDTYSLMRDWSREYQIRLTQTPCGTDVWRAAVGHKI